MARPNMWKLNPMDFTKMTPTRQAKIEQSPADPLPALGSYKPNQIANALHPKVQYLKVAKIVDEDDFTKSFYLEADTEKGTESLAWFNAGQYLSIRLKIGNMNLTRPYSLASSPREALEKAGLKIEDIGLIELNEAFAAQSVAVMREWVKWSDTETFESIWERTNVNGSGISLGHPLAATGGILTTKLFYELKNRPEVRYAMVTMCIGGGMGFASIFEQCRKEG